MIVAGTGHRYISYKGHEQLNKNVQLYIRTWLKENMPSKIITGMAIGFDMLLAHEAIKLKIPVVAAIPFEGHGMSNNWPDKYKKAYKAILALAEEAHLVCAGGYESWKYIKRDEWMVDNCNEVIACWNGARKGGTFKTVAYAIAQPKPIHFIPFMLLQPRD